MAWTGLEAALCEASFMTPAYIRTLKGMPRERHQGGLREWPLAAGQIAQNRPRNANDHEQGARVHPAQPIYSVVVPAPELLCVDVAVKDDIGAAGAFRKGQ